MTKTVTWLADRDGEAHAHVGRGRWTRTACAKPALDPRSVWPHAGRCPACVAEVERLTKAAKRPPGQPLDGFGKPSAMSEPELIAAYGGLPSD